MFMQVKKALAEVNPNLVIYDAQPYSRVIQETFDQQNMIASLTWLFGAVGLVLAAVGLYGVNAYGVEQRRSEIGVRMALGADRGSVTAMVLRGAFWQVGIGLGIGIPAAIGAGYLMSNQLFGVKPWNPLLLAGATMLLGLAAICAAVIPARRAATIDPMQALRRGCAENDPHGSNPDQLQAENGNEEVFGDDRPCAVLGIQKLSERCRFTPAR
jgi:putative ABC transport system permease protein